VDFAFAYGSWLAVSMAEQAQYAEVPPYLAS